MTAPSPGVCPRCRRSYPRPARVCPIDGTPLADQERLAAMEAAATREPAAPHGAPAPEERLGPYRLLRLLGEGGMARIYLAEHAKLGRICAIKRLHRDHFDDKITVARFLAEARAVSDISHKNLVAVYDVVEEADEIYIVMEYLDGVDVAQVLRDETRLSVARAVDVAAQACDGLQAVHERDIIHRDLKPENIFLAREPDGTERVKLLDFGVARLTIDRPKELRTRSGLTVGTPTYMSPEQATASEIDARSDLYAIGVLTFEMITGQPPFVGAGYGDVMLMHVNDPPPRLSSRRADVPSWLDAVVMRCLEKDPDARFADAAELAAALRAAGGTPIALPAAQKKSLTPRAPKRAAARKTGNRKKLLAALGGAAVVGVVAGGVALLTRSPAPPPALEQPAAPPPAAVAPKPAPPRTVRVSTLPPGARVALDGTPICQSPCEVTMPASGVKAEISASLNGWTDDRRVVEVAAPPSEMTLTLRRAPKGAPAAAGPRGKAPAPRKNDTIDPFH
jgi:eukaryotic-like serine/threonine-protein kinase